MAVGAGHLVAHEGIIPLEDFQGRKVYATGIGHFVTPIEHHKI